MLNSQLENLIKKYIKDITNRLSFIFDTSVEFSLNGKEFNGFRESDKLMQHEWSQFQDFLSSVSCVISETEILLEFICINKCLIPFKNWEWYLTSMICQIWQNYLLWKTMMIANKCGLQHNWVFPKWKGNSVNLANSENLVNHWSMNVDQFKDPLSYPCLGGSVLSSLFLTQEEVVLSPNFNFY